MTKKISKAVFPVAGFGTRFLPATKAMPKELLPIIDKPLIQYAVEEAILSGIKTLIFVTGRHKRAIEDHFDRNLELEMALAKKNKLNELNTIVNIIPADVECVFIRQSEQLGLGHAVQCASNLLAGEPFLLSLADIYLGEKGVQEVTEMVNRFAKTGCAQIGVSQVSDAEVQKYGITKTGPDGRVIEMIEKPSISMAPSRSGCIGRYVFNSSILEYLDDTKPARNSEIELTPAINMAAKHEQIYQYDVKCPHFDCGSKKGFIDAVISTAKDIESFDNG